MTRFSEKRRKEKNGKKKNKTCTGTLNSIPQIPLTYARQVVDRSESSVQVVGAIQNHRRRMRQFKDANYTMLELSPQLEGQNGANRAYASRKFTVDAYADAKRGRHPSTSAVAGGQRLKRVLYCSYFGPNATCRRASSARVQCRNIPRSKVFSREDTRSTYNVDTGMRTKQTFFAFRYCKVGLSDREELLSSGKWKYYLRIIVACEAPFASYACGRGSATYSSCYRTVRATRSIFIVFGDYGLFSIFN